MPYPTWRERLLSAAGKMNKFRCQGNRARVVLNGSNVVMGRAKRGLYAGRHIQFGNKISEDGGNKSRRSWKPNVQKKRLFSFALDQFVRVRVTNHALRCIDKAGGLDQYLLNIPDRRLENDLCLYWKRQIQNVQRYIYKLDQGELPDELNKELMEQYKAKKSELARKSKLDSSSNALLQLPHSISSNSGQMRTDLVRTDMGGGDAVITGETLFDYPWNFNKDKNKKKDREPGRLSRLRKYINIGLGVKTRPPLPAAKTTSSAVRVRTKSAKVKAAVKARTVTGTATGTGTGTGAAAWEKAEAERKSQKVKVYGVRTSGDVVAKRRRDLREAMVRTKRAMLEATQQLQRDERNARADARKLLSAKRKAGKIAQKERLENEKLIKPVSRLLKTPA